VYVVSWVQNMKVGSPEAEYKKALDPRVWACPVSPSLPPFPRETPS